MNLHVNTVPKPQPAPKGGPKGLIERLRAPASPTGRLIAASRRRPYLAAAIVAVLLGLAVYAVMTASGSGGPDYITTAVTRGDIEDTVTALGNLQPKDYVDVGAQATGQLKKLYVDIGDTVKQGQLLAEIDPQIQSAKVQTDKGNVANLQAQLRDRQAQQSLASANFARQKRLMAAQATSKSDYDSADQALQSAGAQVGAIRAQIAAAQSQLNGDEVTLGYTKIYAPMSGTVVSVSIKQGQTINSVQQAPTILRIADLSVMTVWTQVSEADVPKLRVGMPVYFTTLGNPGKRWTATLQQIQPTPSVVNNVVLYTATFDAANPDQLLMTQMTAQVFFVTASAHDVVIVPLSALHQGHAHTGGRATSRTPNQDESPAAQSSQPRHRFAKLPAGQKYAFVRVVDASGKIEPRRIVIGVSNRVSAQVISGLEVGERVISGVKQTVSTASSSPSTNSTRNSARGYGGFGGIR